MGESEYHIHDGGSQRSHPWRDGDSLTFVRVRFPGNTRSLPFLVGKRHFQYGQKVLAMSERGMAVGYINSFPYQLPFRKSLLPVHSISRVAEDEDLQEQEKQLDKIRMAQNLCKDLVEMMGLDMTVVHVESIEFGKKMIFYFQAPARVDFRELVKSVVGRLGLRVEMRQLSARDRTAAMGSIGACGLMTCCSSFLQNYGRVSIKMAKNQNLSLVADKVNGVCGQLKCCIKYEDETYREKRQQMPSENDLIRTANGDKGKVVRLHLMSEEFEMLTDKGQLRRYAKKQYLEEGNYPSGETFPNQFDHVVVDNQVIIGGEKKPKKESSMELEWGPPPQEMVMARSDDESEGQSNSPDRREEDERGEAEEDDSADGEEETEEDKLALKKAQSLSLEDQEKAVQGVGQRPHHPNKKGGNGNKWKGKKGRRHFSRKRNKK